MGSEVRVSISTLASRTCSHGKDKEVKGPVSCTSQSENSMVNETAGSLAIEAIRRDIDILDTMTVKELRTLARNVSIPTKGTKKDLVLALKVFSEKMEIEAMSSSVGDGMPSSANLKKIEETSSKRKKKHFSSEEHSGNDSAVSEVSQILQKRTRTKKQLMQIAEIEDDSGTVAMNRQSLSVNMEENLETKISRSRKRETSKVKSLPGMVDPASAPICSEPWTVLAHKKPRDGWVAYNPSTMRPLPLSRDCNFVKLMSWNVNGLRALLKLESFSAFELAQREDFDVLCLQETKIQEKDVEQIKDRLFDGYDNSFWTCSVSKLGYSGTAIISRIKPISVKYGLGILDHDSEGRLVTVEFDKFYLISGYVPNSGDGLRRLTYRVEEWDPSLSNYMKDLEKSKPVVLTGDLNCAHQEIDIYNPAGNRRSAGFTDEERSSFEMNFLSRGFVDTFRKQHPGVVGYTYWGFRHGGRKTNKGWRLDYFLVSESIADEVHDSYILPDVAGSDHCPIGLILKL